MNTLKISATEFDYNDNRSDGIADHPITGDYMSHNIDVFNKIVINDREFEAVYIVSICDDENDTTYQLVLSEDGPGTHPLLILINKLYSSDFENKEYINEVLEEVMGYMPAIDTVAKLEQVYHFLNENHPGNIFNFINVTEE